MSILKKVLNNEPPATPRIKNNNPTVKITETTSSTWNAKSSFSVPLSIVDAGWKKNLDYIKKEIVAAQDALQTSEDNLEKAKEQCNILEIENSDCRKKLIALRDAECKLQSVVPPREDIIKRGEPQLLLESQTKKKVAKKKPRGRNAK